MDYTNDSKYRILFILGEKSLQIMENMIFCFYLPRILYKRVDIDIILELYRLYHEDNTLVANVGLSQWD